MGLVTKGEVLMGTTKYLKISYKTLFQRPKTWRMEIITQEHRELLKYYQSFMLLLNDDQVPAMVRSLYPSILLNDKKLVCAAGHAADKFGCSTIVTSSPDLIAKTDKLEQLNIYINRPGKYYDMLTGNTY